MPPFPFRLLRGEKEKSQRSCVMLIVWFVLALSNLSTPAYAQTLHETDPHKTDLETATDLALKEPEEARALVKKLEARFEAADDALGLAKTAYAYGKSYIPAAEFKKARDHYLRALSLIEEEDDPVFYGLVLNNIGVTYANEVNYVKAFEYGSYNLALSEKYNNLQGIATGRYSIGNTLSNIYDFDGALEYLELAVEDPNLPDYLRPWAINSLAFVHAKLGNADEAIQFHREAVSLLTDEDSNYDWIVVLYVQSWSLTHFGYYDEAQKTALKALALAREEGSTLYECEINVILAMIADGQGDPQRALDHFTNASSACRATDEGDELAQVRHEIDILPAAIRSYLALGQADTAIELFARLLTAQEKNFDIILATKLSLEHVRNDIAQRDGQIQFLEQQAKLQDSELRRRTLFLILSGASVLGLLALSLFVYRSNLSQVRVNAALKANAATNWTRATKAEKSLKYKSLLIHEINHRVRNNMQSIISIMNIHRRRIGASATTATIEILNDVARRVQALAIVQQAFENIEEAPTINADGFMTNLVGQLTATSSFEIETSITVDDVFLEPATAGPLALILNELISNAMKHAFKESEGHLKITLKRFDDDQLELRCSDDGPGLPHDLDLNNLDSFGLNIIEGLTHQLNGTLHFHKQESGASISVIFPVPELHSSDGH